MLGIAGILDSDFCQIVLHMSCLLYICGSRSDFQRCPSVPVYFWLFCAILLHDPIGVWCTLVYYCCWFPCSILSVLDPNWCTWGEFNVTFFWFITCLFMSSCQVWYISWVPRVLGSWGRFFPLVYTVSVIAMVMQCCLTVV